MHSCLDSLDQHAALLMCEPGGGLDEMESVLFEERTVPGAALLKIKKLIRLLSDQVVYAFPVSQAVEEQRGVVRGDLQKDYILPFRLRLRKAARSLLPVTFDFAHRSQGSERPSGCA